MLGFRHVPFVYVAGIATACVAMAALSAPNAASSVPQFKSVTNLPNFDCASKNSTGASQKCAKVVFEVQVVRIKQVDRTEVACVAYFPYSELTIHTTTQGDPVVLHWHLSEAGASFEGKGIKVKEDFGDAEGDLFEPATSSTSDATLKLKAGVKIKKKFNHFPDVSLLFGSERKACDGADPVISNSAD